MLGYIATRAVPIAIALGAETQLLSSRENNIRLFGLVIVSNLLASGVTMISLGMRVGKARTEYKVPLPAMYANENTEDAKKFNSVQRGHQQALETYPFFLAGSAIAGTRFPVTTSLAGLLYCAARIKWADNYRDEGADNRYNSWLAKQIWTPLVILMLSSLGLATELILDVHKGIL